MARHDAVFGGEHSAHYYFRDFWFADTGMLAAMHALAALGEQPEPLSTVMGDLARYSASGEINSTVTDAPGRDRAGARLGRPAGCRHRRARRPDPHPRRQRTTTPMWWFNLRASNTEPLLRLNVEAADP